MSLFWRFALAAGGAALLVRAGLAQDESPQLREQAAALVGQARYAEAAPLLARALEAAERELGPEDPRLTGVLGELATVLRMQGANPEAEKLGRRSLAIKEKALGAACIPGSCSSPRSSR